MEINKEITTLELLKIIGDPENKGKLKVLGIREIDKNIYTFYSINDICFVVRI